MKKETLEEAVKKRLLLNEKTGFIDGAKWQEEKNYSAEDLKKAQSAILCNIKDALMDDNYIINYLNQLKNNQ